jgi:hypothetical protein
MSKKRGPNSPMESEKTKQSTSASAAASTMGMAAMMSVVNSVFSKGDPSSAASSVVSDSEEEYSQAIGNDNPWNDSNVSNSTIKQPKSSNELKALFKYTHEGAVRDEIEVEILTKNDRKFTGSITPLEAKYDIYLGALGFENHDNFDGVRINYKGKLVVTFKLIEPINIDDLSSVEHFEFKRMAKVNGKDYEDVIGCKIKGIRYRAPTVGAFEDFKPDNGEKVVKIEGCEYRVTEEEILAWLSLYGEVTSDLKEDCFRDANHKTGNNRTGNYSITMKLERDIPQLLPMCGRRIKMYHAGIQKLCTNCFGPHKKQFCTSQEKVPWITYVKDFIDQNDDIPEEFFGRWLELVKKIQEEAPGSRYRPNTQSHHEAPEKSNQTNSGEKDSASQVPESQLPSSSRPTQDVGTPETTIGPEPTKEGFDIPTTSEAYERMVDRLATVGLERWEVDKAIEAKTTAFNRACREHKKKITEFKKRGEEANKKVKNTRKNSLSKQ